MSRYKVHAFLDHRALLTWDLFTYDDKDDAMVCLCTAYSFTPCYGTLLRQPEGVEARANSARQ